jgi:hypothetical protein
MTVRLAKYWAALNTLLFFFLVASIAWRLESNADFVAVKAARASLVHEVVFALGLDLMCWTTCAPGVKAGNEIIEVLEASTAAESILNHTLKNSIAGVITLMEVDEQEDSWNKPTHHDQIKRQLYQSMRWCSSRQLLTELVAGRYVPVLTQVDIRAFIEGGGLNKCSCRGSIKS